MKTRKPIASLYDDAQLRTMGAVLDRVVTVMRDMGTVASSATETYRRYVAGVIVKVAREGVFDEDELTQRVLEALIRPPANNDGKRPPRSEPALRAQA